MNNKFYQLESQKQMDITQLSHTKKDHIDLIHQHFQL